eukprot:3670623-Rhodomonas_salina.1
MHSKSILLAVGGDDEVLHKVRPAPHSAQTLEDHDRSNLPGVEIVMMGTVWVLVFTWHAKFGVISGSVVSCTLCVRGPIRNLKPACRSSL